jgi:hypothetical protein
MSDLPYGFEVDKAPLNVDRHQLHAHSIADIQALATMNQLSFNRRLSSLAQVPLSEAPG